MRSSAQRNTRCASESSSERPHRLQRSPVAPPDDERTFIPVSCRQSSRWRGGGSCRSRLSNICGIPMLHLRSRSRTGEQPCECGRCVRWRRGRAAHKVEPLRCTSTQLTRALRLLRRLLRKGAGPLSRLAVAPGDGKSKIGNPKRDPEFAAFLAKQRSQNAKRAEQGARYGDDASPQTLEPQSACPCSLGHGRRVTRMMILEPACILFLSRPDTKQALRSRSPLSILP